MDWLTVALQWAGWGGLCAAGAALLRDRWARQSEREKTVVSARQVEVTATEVEVQERSADAGVFDTALRNYHELVEMLRSEIDAREEQHQADLERITTRVAALEAENVHCNEKVATLQREVERIAAENYQLRQRLGG